MVPVPQAFQTHSSKVHGETDAVLLAMHQLAMGSLLSARPCRQANLVMAMIAARIVAPHTKLVTTR